MITGKQEGSKVDGNGDSERERERQAGRDRPKEREEKERICLFGWLVGWFLNVLVNF